VYRGLLLQLSPCNQIVQRGLVAICLVRASTYLFSFWLFVKASNLNFTFHYLGFLAFRVVFDHCTRKPENVGFVILPKPEWLPSSLLVLVLVLLSSYKGRNILYSTLVSGILDAPALRGVNARHGGA
jgi:hypothetical protein